MSDPLANEGGRRADWSDYRIFGEVVKHGGFNPAARALGMNQAGLSRRVRDLELRLSVKLLERRHDGVVLTEAGELIFDHIQNMERSATSIETLVRDRDRKPEGRVVISTPDGVGAFLIAPVIGDFLAENPAIRLVLDCGVRGDVAAGSRPEITLGFERPTDPEIVAEPVAWGHWVIFASQRYVDRYGMPTTLPQAADHRVVDLSSYGQYDRGSWTDRAEGFMRLRSVGVQTDSSALLFLAVCNGAGISALPTYALSIDPNLVLIDVTTRVSLPLWMCHHRDVAHSTRVRKVQDWLRTIFDARTKPWFRKEFIHPAEFMDLARAHAGSLFEGTPTAIPAPEPAPRRRSSGV